MNYLTQLKQHINSNDYPSFLTLWEEYCLGDEIDTEELIQILEETRDANFAEPFGKYVDQILPLWKELDKSPEKSKILQLIIDLQTTNDKELAQLAIADLEEKYVNEPNYQEKLRLVGLREQKSFKGALSNFLLLAHVKKKHFVFHTGGWGVGEIIDVSFLREQLTLEFDYIAGYKEFSFQNAFNTLLPIPNDHFLAMRFGDPDKLEEKAKKEPVEVIRMLLRDCGPKTAAEIKDEVCELVIPTDDWARWWQNARAKIKKDTMIETPPDLKTPFRIRPSEITHEERLQRHLEKKPDANTLIQLIYSFTRDFPAILKNNDFKQSIYQKLTEILSEHELTDAQELQIQFFLKDMSQEPKNQTAVEELIKRLSSIEDVINEMDIVAFKKRTLTYIRSLRDDWSVTFLNLLLSIAQNPIRDYILTELLKEKKEKELTLRLQELISFPNQFPGAFLWYFQKVTRKANNLPFSDQEGKNRLFESFLILLSQLEHSGNDRDLIKKMLQFITNGRYAIVRKIFQGASKEVVQEFLLLATKCFSLTEHDIKIFHSLAEVVHPSLAKLSKKYQPEEDLSDIIWTTKEGFIKVKNRLHQIATVETVENAKEIEVARSHGDLRENAEFKAALEKRDRLQGELKLLSVQIQNARILTDEDIDTNQVGVGVVIKCKAKAGKELSYTLLGPWDADVDRNILSFQSKLAQSMMGLKVGDTFKLQDDQLTILSIHSYFDSKERASR